MRHLKVAGVTRVLQLQAETENPDCLEETDSHDEESLAIHMGLKHSEPVLCNGSVFGPAGTAVGGLRITTLRVQEGFSPLDQDAAFCTNYGNQL